MSRDDNAEDLLVMARQCRLGEEEERRFQVAVGSSRELELLYDAGVHFDEQAGLLPGDETRFDRLVERTLAHLDRAGGLPEARLQQAVARADTRSTHRALAARYFGASLAFGLLLSVALASAWDYVEQRHLAQRAVEPQAMLTARSGPAVLPRTVAPLGASPLGAAPEAAPSARTELQPSAVPAKSAPRAAATQPLIDRETDAHDQEPSSSQLFARANQARREGDIEAAISLYERLGKNYPSAVEAEDAKVLLGNLLLDQRSPRAALRQFENYGSGALKLEALWGRAQALRKLGSPDEKAALVELVRDYPDSPYSEAAKKRLSELSP